MTSARLLAAVTDGRLDSLERETMKFRWVARRATLEFSSDPAVPFARYEAPLGQRLKGASVGHSQFRVTLRGCGMDFQVFFPAASGRVVRGPKDQLTGIPHSRLA
jgi:hypothetical protein